MGSISFFRFNLTTPGVLLNWYLLSNEFGLFLFWLTFSFNIILYHYQYTVVDSIFLQYGIQERHTHMEHFASSPNPSPYHTSPIGIKLSITPLRAKNRTHVLIAGP